MIIENTFTIPVGRDAVWDLFQDIESVAACLPGATLGGVDTEGRYLGTFTAKLGPIRASFDGAATVTVDPVNYTGRINGSGADQEGGSRGTVEITYTLVGDEAETNVVVDTDFSLTGAAAQFGRAGLIQEVSEQIVEQFISCLEARLEQPRTVGSERALPEAAAEVSGFRLVFRAILRRIKSLVRRLLRRS